MKKLTPELIAMAKTAKSAEELLELAKANGVELTEADAKTYFEQLNANGVVADDELGAVAGGSDSPDSEEEKPQYLSVGTKVKIKCPNNCTNQIGIIAIKDNRRYVKCKKCYATVYNFVDDRTLEMI